MIVTSKEQTRELYKAFKSEMRLHRSDNEEFNYLTDHGYCVKKPGYTKGSSKYFITVRGINKLKELGELSEKELLSIF